MIAGGSGPEIEAGTVDDRAGFYHTGLQLQLDFCQRRPTLLPLVGRYYAPPSRPVDQSSSRFEAPPMSSDPPPKLSFPCSYPVKVMVRAHPEVRSQVDAIMERHAGPLDLSTVSERSSAQARFLGLTYVINAQSEAQIAELFAALKTVPEVLLVL